MHSEYYDPIYLFFCRTRGLLHQDHLALDELRKAVWSNNDDTRTVALYFLREIAAARRRVPLAVTV